MDIIKKKLRLALSCCGMALSCCICCFCCGRLCETGEDIRQYEDLKRRLRIFVLTYISTQYDMNEGSGSKSGTEILKVCNFLNSAQIAPKFFKYVEEKQLELDQITLSVNQKVIFTNEHYQHRDRSINIFYFDESTSTLFINAAVQHSFTCCCCICPSHTPLPIALIGG